MARHKKLPVVIVQELVRCRIREGRTGFKTHEQERVGFYNTKKEATARGKIFGKKLTEKEYRDFRNRIGTKEGFVILARIVLTEGAPKGTGFVLMGFTEKDLIRLPRSE